MENGVPISPHYNVLKSILLKKDIPEDIIPIIIIMVYGMEHVEKVSLLRLNYEIKAYALSFEKIRIADPENACEFWHKCKCCKAHQINKGIMSYRTGAPTIITRPMVFNPNTVYWGNVAPSPRWHDIPEEAYNGARCYCHCRHWTRDCVRRQVENLYGKNNRRERYTLYIHRNHAINEEDEVLEMMDDLGQEGLAMGHGGQHL